MASNELERKRLRLRRLRILQVLQMNRPDPVGDGMLNSVLQDDTDLAFTKPTVRKAVEYLSGRGLVEVLSKENDRWMIKLTPNGIDYVDGFGDDIEGVARPQEF